MNYTLAKLDIDVLLDRIDDLEMWIHSMEDLVDVCTWSVFGELCDGCRCKHRDERASKSKRKAAGTADENPDGQAENARDLAPPL
jgi:hypothetical protein